jgi:hypothetical protein
MFSSDQSGLAKNTKEAEKRANRRAVNVAHKSGI